jgi:hypothetical protein
MLAILLKDVPVKRIWAGDTFSSRTFIHSHSDCRMGGLTFVMFVLRFFVFHLYESPKFLMGRGKNAAAVETVHAVAKYNGKTSTLRVEHLDSIDEMFGRDEAETTATAAVKRNLEKFNLSHVRGLFATRKLAFSTSLTILLWGLIGLAFPLYNAFLPYFLATRGAESGDGSISMTYRNTVIIALMGSSLMSAASYIRNPWSVNCCLGSGTSSYWTQGSHVYCYRPHWSISLLLNHCTDLKRLTGMELWIQYH